MDTQPVPTRPDQVDGLRVQAHALRESACALVARSIELRAESRGLPGRAAENAENAEAILGELRTSIEGLAKVLRELGEPPEQAVKHIKLIRDEAVTLVRSQCPTTTRDQLAVTKDLVRWAIDAYYAA